MMNALWPAPLPLQRSMHMDPARSPLGGGAGGAREVCLSRAPAGHACDGCAAPLFRGARAARRSSTRAPVGSEAAGGLSGKERNVKRVALSEESETQPPMLVGRDLARREVRLCEWLPLSGEAGARVGIPSWTNLSCVSERDPAHVRGSFMGATPRRAGGQMPGSSDPGLASHACQRGTPRVHEVRLAGWVGVGDLPM